MYSREKPLVSICVPIYGVELFIERCAHSLFGQTYPNIEYIFVDDCSPDNSLTILEEQIKKYPERIDNISIIHHEKNRGLAAARNTAVAAVSGDFIMHVDSDDWIENNAVEVLVNRQGETNADIVSGDAVLEYPDRFQMFREPIYKSKNEMLYDVVNMSLHHTLWRRLIRTSLYKDHDIFAVEGVNIGEDHYTLPRLVYYAKAVSSVNQVIYHYNLQNNASYTQAQNPGIAFTKHDSNIKSLDIILDFFKEKDNVIVQHTEKIKFDYLYSKLWYTVKYGRKDVFQDYSNQLVSLSKYSNNSGISEKHLEFVINHYWIDRIIVLLRILQWKLIKIKLYRL